MVKSTPSSLADRARHRFIAGSNRLIKLSAYLLLPFVLLSACNPEPPPNSPLSHDAYVWQHQWTPALHEALTSAAPWLERWRVLAAEVRRGGRFAPVAIDPQALAKSSKPVFAVIRINGQLTDWDATQITADSLAVIAKWREQGVNVIGLEIDHDCATRRLPNYLRFVAQLRQAVASQRLKIAVTALPAWLDAPELPLLLGHVDEAVIQVHAVADPRHGLFDSKQAGVWVQIFAAISPVPFRVAMPNYGSRVMWDEKQHAVAVESEVPLGLDDASAQELAVAPEAVAAMLDEWRKKPPGGFAGVAWFRLPTRDDRRSWSLDTWQAVLQGRKLQAHLTAYAKPSADPGLQDIFLQNDSDIDAQLPNKISIQANGECTADAIGSYHIAAIEPAVLFHLSRPAVLKARKQTAVGWIRCINQQVSINVDF